MKSHLSWIMWSIVLLALGTSCGGEPTLLVRLTEWPAGAETLNVVPWLNGVRHDEITVPKGRPGFAVTLPEGTSGEIRLQIVALDAERCKVGAVEVTESVGSSLRATHEQEVQIIRLAEPVCTLGLELPSDVSVVSTIPPGLVCPMGSVRCESEFPKGSPIKVMLQFDPHTYEKLSLSGATCNEEGMCSIDLERSKSLHGDLAKRKCSPDGFCSYGSVPQGITLRGVWGSHEKNVWAVGAGGTILNWNGFVWVAQRSSTTEDLFGIWGTDAENVWAVGRNGTIVKWNGTTWATQGSPTTQTLRSIGGFDASHVWAVGYGGTILNWDETQWVTQVSPTKNDLNAVWGSKANNVWAVGDGGTILRLEGNDWSPIATTTPYSFYAVRGSGVSPVWAAGPFGMIWKWNGMEWSEETGGPSQPNFYGMWAVDAKNVWVVGQGGSIFKGNGIGWASKDSGTIKDRDFLLLGVWGSSANDIWVVGTASTILRWKVPTAPPLFSVATVVATTPRGSRTAASL